MQNTAIVDTSCLIALSKLSHFDLLNHLFQEVITTNAVQKEFGYTLPAWIVISNNPNDDKENQLASFLDEGEASIIALALNFSSVTIIIDEKKGRLLAKQQKLKTIGTLKVLLIAKQKGLISAINPLILKLQKFNFRLNKDVVNQILVLANEQ